MFLSNFWFVFSISLTIKIHNNNVNTSKVTNKHRYKIILFQKFLSNKTDIFRELLPNTTDVFQGNCTRQYFFLPQIWTYSKSLLIEMNVNSTFRTVFDFKKLKIRHCWDIYYFLLWLQASAFLKSALPTRNELYWDQILTRPFNVISRIVACNSIT